jgi:hypothetical protein
MTVGVGSLPAGASSVPPAEIYAVSSLSVKGQMDKITLTFIGSATNNVTRTVSAQGFPYNVLVASSGQEAYLFEPGPPADDDSSPWSMKSLDVATGELGAPFTIGSYPVSAALSPNGTEIYVLNTNAPCCAPPGGQLTVFSAATRKVLKIMKVTFYALTLAIAPEAKFALVLSGQPTRAATVLNLASDSAVATVKGVSPVWAFSPDGSTAYLGGQYDIVPVFLASGKAGKAISTGIWDPLNLAVSASGQTLYVLASIDPGQGLGDLDALLELSTSTGKVTKTVDLAPESIDFSSLALSANGAVAYAWGSPTSGHGSGMVIPVNLAAGKAGTAIASGLDPVDVVSPTGSPWAYVLVKDGVLPVATATDAAGKLIGVAAGGVELGVVGEP